MDDSKKTQRDKVLTSLIQGTKSAVVIVVILFIGLVLASLLPVLVVLFILLVMFTSGIWYIELYKPEFWDDSKGLR